jgi:DNA-directed RNA polymerase specialized sigma24 family protein
LPDRLDHLPPTPARPKTAFGWLYVVARNEAYRLSTIQRREHQPTDVRVDSTIPDRVTLDDQLHAREALRALAQLPAAQKRDLTLLIAGYSYRDISQLTGGRTYTNVNKHLVNARARIRRQQSDDTTGESEP